MISTQAPRGVFDGKSHVDLRPSTPPAGAPPASRPSPRRARASSDGLEDGAAAARPPRSSSGGNLHVLDRESAQDEAVLEQFARVLKGRELQPRAPKGRRPEGEAPPALQDTMRRADLAAKQNFNPRRDFPPSAMLFQAMRRRYGRDWSRVDLPTTASACWALVGGRTPRPGAQRAERSTFLAEFEDLHGGDAPDVLTALNEAKPDDLRHEGEPLEGRRALSDSVAGPDGARRAADDGDVVRRSQPATPARRKARSSSAPPGMDDDDDAAPAAPPERPARTPSPPAPEKKMSNAVSCGRDVFFRGFTTKHRYRRAS